MSKTENNSSLLNAPNCFNCVFFTVSWNPQFPRQCKKFGFKGKELPSTTVFKTTGQHCPVFLERKKKSKQGNNP